MNSELLFDAVGAIDDEYVAAAARRLGFYIAPGTQRRQRHPLRRALVGLAAAVALLVACTLTAMAVSEPVREAVLSFFGVEYRETVPDVSPGQGTLELTQVRDLGGIEARYYAVPGCIAPPRRGFFFDGDALRYESGAGSFERVETERFDSTLDVQGEQVRVMFDYAVRGGVAAIANVEPGQAAAWEPLSVFGDPAALGVVCIVGGRRCPVLLDLDTGEYVDILGGLDVDTFDFDTGAASERGMLYRVSGSWVWYDTELGESVDLSCFSGERVDFCALAGDAIACWSYRGEGPDMTVHVWSIDMATLERTDILYDTPAKDIVLCPAEGFDTPGAAFALLPDDGNVVSILDLESGERRSISGPAIPAADCCAYASPDGTRMLICEAGDEGYYGNIAVIDSVSGTFEVIERENTSNVYEKHCYWYDAGAVAVTGRDRDTGEDVCYVYSFD